MKVDLVVERAALEKLREEWEGLAASDARNGFFRSHAWHAAWRHHLGERATPHVVVVRDGSGALAGLAPLVRQTYPRFGAPVGGIGFSGREVVSGDFLDVLALPEHRAAVLDAVFDRLWEDRGRWGLLVVGEALDGSDLEAKALDFARRHRLTMRREDERVCPFIALPGSWDEFLKSLGESSRYNVRRRTREVLEKAGAKVRILREPSEVVAGLDTLIRLHLAHWNRLGDPGTLGHPGFAAFLRTLCGSPPPGAESRLYLLEHEGTTHAAAIAFHAGASAHYYQAGWDPDSSLASKSPGVVLIGQSVRDAIESGRRWYEFLQGDEAYKWRWTSTARRSSTLVLARSATGRAVLAGARFRDMAVKTVRRLSSPPDAPVPDA